MSREFTPHYGDPAGAIVREPNVGALFARGTTVPTDGTVGFAPGCIFLDTNATAGGQVFVNEGTYASCDFNAISAGAGRIRSGVATVTGTLTVVTGLATVTSVQATMQADASLTNGISTTATIGDQAGTPAAGSVILKVWKPTGSGDVTPIASAAAVAVNWIAIGT